MPTDQNIQISGIYINIFRIYVNFESMGMIYYEVCYRFLCIFHNYTWYRYKRLNNIVQNNGLKLYADRSKNSNFLYLHMHIWNVCQL